METLLWGVFPYIVATIFIGGHLYRYQKDQMGWTTKSSELLEKRRLRVGSLLFHWGLMVVFGGHVMGLLIPIGVYESLGVSEHTYHLMAIIFGLPAGIATIIGVALLTYRRFSVKRLRATSTPSDWVTLILLLLVIGTGLLATTFNVDSHGFDYRTTIAPWLRGLFIFRVDPSLMATVPIWFKIHIFMTFVLYSAWPFTRLVHAFSFPIHYLSRSYVIYKRKADVR
ncbi:respiratory nitrate reductase subunit gamma [Aureibacillus halotolerans]|uniref:Respiratory nitrate reductase gamma subunit n=1 Tax=Aureibacillus halotolerans TaxID=1508390 RepID=A0A4R6U813_9BACI|nr:respiratory nitrate reductase subunit gamma [Aureibacillus halotolerans]TDQ40735.1 respiratory nitrate reductase gamma subunit [Aureibacillus halotolerans]